MRAYGHSRATGVNGGYNTQAYYNPFRYRGYYYDRDMELYMLGTRYYDSYTGRFISPDSYISTGQSFTGFNMYAYCGNNPVSRANYCGELFLEIVAAIIILVSVYAFGRKIKIIVSFTYGYGLTAEVGNKSEFGVSAGVGFKIGWEFGE